MSRRVSTHTEHQHGVRPNDHHDTYEIETNITRSTSITKRESDIEHREGSLSVQEVEEEDLPHHLYVYEEPNHVTSFPNRWSRIRYWLREPAAEFLGTMILIIFGNGVDCQVVLSGSMNVSPAPKGDYLSISFGWGVGTAMGVWVSGGYSGGHINPAVTIALATFRQFPWWKVPIYILAQVLGAFTGALITYATYFHALDAFEGKGVRTVPGTAALFATYAMGYETSVSCFFDEFLGTALLVIGVLAITDKKNGPPPAGLVPLVLFLLILGEGACLGMNTAYAINPARDLGPRIMTWIFYGREVFNYRHQYWLWTPILGPIFGGLAGAFVYDAFCFTGAESILNKPNATARRHHERAMKSARDKIPAGIDNV
ncbi:aquaporin [Sistotremastrum suecicum HHB10207 ss-3]|uniref:Aquaporin n=1 Tax=Sistotremastrum suecicum HHB10207 ss-3 TaxID=1314776 RepID=A0A166BCD6_9AGAM|nr:aquaporin [Sistotremastrum suecicum HHB10207 ss-3]